MTTMLERYEASTEGHDGQVGQGLVEYGLILTLIAVVAIVALAFLGSSLSALLVNIGNSV